MLPNGFLTISPVTRTDEGTYTCLARNSLGADRTHGFLRVFSRPKVYVRPDPVYERRIGDSVELPCMAVSDAKLDVSYIWLHNGLRVDIDKMPQYSMGTFYSPCSFLLVSICNIWFVVAEIDGYLLINNLTLAETGEYECVIQTTVGSASASTRIQLYAPPGAPGAVLADDISATTARLHWSDGSENGRRITGYMIEGITNHDNRWVVLANSTEYVNQFSAIRDTGRKMVYLRDVLSPWSTYRFRVSAINELGIGPSSDPSPYYNTDKAVPFKAPNNVNGGGGGKTGTLTIMWDPLPPKDWNAPDIWYRIYYKFV